jgi:1-acyl-sn-glycerol-3-phosphate acyltransferase
MLRKFQSGVGFLVARSKATVIPVWISGTPRVDVAMQSLWKRGRARIEFGEPMRFDDVQDSKAIAPAIRDRIAAMSGWPSSEIAADTHLDSDSVLAGAAGSGSVIA